MNSKKPNLQKSRWLKYYESDIQGGFLEWLALQYPKVSAVTFSVPNGGKRTYSYANRLKSEGMVAGVPDVFVAYPSYPYSGFFIEFKKPGIKAKEEQDKMIDLFQKQGYKAEVFSDIEEGIKEFKKYLEGGKCPTCSKSVADEKLK